MNSLTRMIKAKVLVHKDAPFNGYLDIRSAICEYNPSEEEDPPVEKAGRNSQNNNKTRYNTVSSLILHPNPNKGSFIIELPVRGNYTVSITNIVGRRIYQSKFVDVQKANVHLGYDTPPGNYIIRISGESINHNQRITITQ